MKGNLTRILLVRRNALWTTLAALRLNYKTFGKNFVELKSQLEDFGELVKNPIVAQEIAKVIGKIKHNHIKTYIGDIYNNIQEDIIVNAPNLKDQTAFINLINRDAVTLMGLAEIFLTGPGLAIDAVSWAYHTKKMGSLYHLIPEEGEFDPDQCTCPVVGGMEHPCQEIAKRAIKNRSGAAKKSALSLVTLGEFNIALTLVKGVRSFRALVDGETAAEIFLNNKTLCARHLWNAAQTFGKSSQEPPKRKAHYYNAYEAYTSRGVIPGISIHKYGCPKAISIIAALFGEYHEKTNYMKAIAAISAYNGPSIIEKELI